MKNSITTAGCKTCTDSDPNLNRVHENTQMPGKSLRIRPFANIHIAVDR